MDPRSASLARIVLTFAPLLAAGIVATLLTIANRDADPLFLSRQQNLHAVRTADVERAVIAPREPVAPGAHATPARSARCRSGGSAGLRNPWTCSVRYRSGSRITYRVQLGADGSYRGRDPKIGRSITGCCVVTQ